MISPFISPTIGVLTLGIEQLVCPYLPDFALLLYMLWFCMGVGPVPLLYIFNEMAPKAIEPITVGGVDSVAAKPNS